MKQKLLLFDIDGTILASGGAGIRALEEAGKELFGNADISGIEIAGRTDSAIAQQLYARAGAHATPGALAKFYDCYLSHLARFLPITDGSLLPGIIELLEQLRARPGCVLGLLTGNLERGAKLKLSHYGVWHFFEFGAYADDSHDRNLLGPVARSRARDRYGVEFAPQDIIILGDTPHDIACARAIGAKAVAIATGRHTRVELEACEPDYFFEDLRDVPAVIEKLGL